MIMAKNINILDTTLRDGAQSAQINFSVNDKIRILHALDDLGLCFAEAGSPGISNNDKQLFELLKKESFKKLQIVAFSPLLAINELNIPSSLDNVIEASFEYISLFGKADCKQVSCIMGITPEQNLELIHNTISYAVKKNKKVIFEAEHFFKGYINDPDYALEVVDVAAKAGAERIILCDTNGGMLTEQVTNIVKAVRKNTHVILGIHCHNDSGLAVANTLAACRNGISDVHGTICGIGERCGNTDLCVAIPDLQLKLGFSLLSPSKLATLTHIARKIADISNIQFNEHSPYVGRYAFAHKAGTHIDAELKSDTAFQHIKPELVGNKSMFLVSNQSGRAAIVDRLKSYDPDIDKNSPYVSEMLLRIKNAEDFGYQFENADGSLALIILDVYKKRPSFFRLLDFKIVLGDPTVKNSKASALIKIEVEGVESLIAEEGIGPVNAIDRALKKALNGFYPALSGIKLSDYRVRVIDSDRATEAKVMVSIETKDNACSWRTIGVSTDIIEASWIALCDSIDYKLSHDIGLL